MIGPRETREFLEIEYKQVPPNISDGLQDLFKQSDVDSLNSYDQNIVNNCANIPHYSAWPDKPVKKVRFS